MIAEEMRCIALTGGIATGKSTAGRCFQKLEPSIALFDCDQAARALLTQVEVLDLVVAHFGPSLLDDERQLKREVLREKIFSDPNERKALEVILHPLIRKECLEKLELSRKQAQSSLFIADVPLLFESGFDFGQECCLVVATSEQTQRVRLKERNGFDDALITSILAAQMPILHKVARADVVFWNEGPPSLLERQIFRFLKQF